MSFLGQPDNTANNSGQMISETLERIYPDGTGVEQCCMIGRPTSSFTVGPICDRVRQTKPSRPGEIGQLLLEINATMKVETIK